MSLETKTGARGPEQVMGAASTTCAMAPASTDHGKSVHRVAATALRCSATPPAATAVGLSMTTNRGEAWENPNCFQPA